MTKITESLRRTWRSQRDQAVEELAGGRHQDGQFMTDESKREFEVDIASMNKLLGYPVGTKFERASDLL